MTIDAEEVKKNCDLAAIVGHYTPLVKKGREYVGRCIAHSPDEHPSMYVVPDKGFVHCFSCGFSSDIIGFIMEVESLDFEAALTRLNGDSPQWQPAISVPTAPPPPERITSKPPAAAPTPKMGMEGFGEPIKIYPFKDSEGSLIMYEARYDVSDPNMKARQWTWGRRGDNPPAWACGMYTKPRPLYGLDRLAQRPDAQVLVTEGPKKADAGKNLLPSCVSISWAGGWTHWDKYDWLPVANRKLLLMPDADDVGYAAMQKLANLLSDPAGLGCAVRVVDMNRMPEGYDLADFEKDGWDTARLIEWAKPRTSDYIHISLRKEPPNQAVAERGEESPPIGMAEKPVKPKRQKKPPLTVVGGTSSLAEELDTEEVPLQYSEDGVAGQFVALHHDQFRVCHEWGSSSKPMWLAWDGTRWKRDRNRVTAMQLAKDLAMGLKYQPGAAGLSPAVKDRFETMKFKGAFLDSASFDRHLVASAETFDNHPLLLNTPQGTIDLTTGLMRGHRQEDYLTYQTTISPAPGPTPLWDSVLAFPSGCDPAIEAYLWRALGYGALTGDTREEALFFLRGNPGSGKSTMINALADIMGDYAVNISMDALIEQKHMRHPQEIAKLEGKRFIHANETQQHRRWNEALICKLTGRDVISAHLMRMNDTEYKPTGKIWIHGNYTPHLKSVEGGIARRLHLIEYHQRALPEAEQDNTLKDRLHQEYPAILHKMIQGCMDWLQIGLKRPPEIAQNVQEYMEDEDMLGAWFTDCCDKSNQAEASTREAHKSLKEWAEHNGENIQYLPSPKRFTQTMKQRGYAIKRGGAGNIFIGFALKDGPRQVEEDLPLPEVPADWQDRF